MKLKSDAQKIIAGSISKNLPVEAVERVLSEEKYDSDIILIAFGKAAYKMSFSAKNVLKDRIKAGICITKYGHSEGKVEGIEIYEAGHPIPDENSVLATKRAIEIIKDSPEDFTILLLISGGGSALFEMPLIELNELKVINEELIKSGANISEINCVRKHLSKVKGGRLCELAGSRKIRALVLSDVINDSLDVIASGVVFPDRSTSEEALRILDKYGIEVSSEAKNVIKQETPKKLENVDTKIIGSVSNLCAEAKKISVSLGYETEIIKTDFDGEASEAARILCEKQFEHGKKAFILGGESVVKVNGLGKGGRNQEIALLAAKVIEGNENALVFSVGSDGTDGPTDAAGGIVDGRTNFVLREKGIDIDKYLTNNDSYNALIEADGLIFTGPTGTNVNDLMCILIDRED